MKKYNNKSQTGGAYDGCVLSGLKLTIMGAVIIAICMVVFGCKTQQGCGSYSKWESKHSFNK